MLRSMSPYAVLGIAGLVWFGIHRGIAGSPLRAVLIRRLGEGAYRGSFSLLSVLSLWFLIHAYRKAPCEPLWTTPRALFFLPLVFVPLGFVLLVGAFSVPNPTAVAGERALRRADAARGALRITRHPFLWGVSCWAGSHLIVNGNVPALVLFGSLLATALVGTTDIDKKRAASDPASWATFAAVTSNLPFAAIAGGRNRLVLRELALPLLLGLALSGVFLHFHSALFGLSALRALSLK